MRKYTGKIMRNMSNLTNGLLFKYNLKRTPYQKFLILTPGRSGSTMLIDCLNQHPQIDCHYEVYPLNKKEVFWRQYLRLFDPVLYLNAFVYGKYPETTQAVGFSLHYYHCRTGMGQRLWPYLGKNPSIKILHLTRNPFHIQVSSQRAWQTGVWHLKKDQQPGNCANQVWININAKKCEAYFKEFDAYNQQFKSLFPNHAILDIRYEDLLKGFDFEVEKMHDWLGLEHQPAEQRYIKINQRPIHELVENYNELKAKFINSPWGQYFLE